MSGLVLHPVAQAGVVVSLTPLSVTLNPLQTVTLTATVAGTTQAGVTWSTPSAGTLISTGNIAVYTAPVKSQAQVRCRSPPRA